MRLLEPRSGGRWLAALESEGPPDFMGALLTEHGALPVMAEAKNNADGRWALKQLKKHQADSLAALHRMGGVAVVLVNHVPQRLAYVLPWCNLAPVWTRWYAIKLTGRKAPPRSASLGDGDLAALGVSFKPDDGGAYLRAMLACAPRPPDAL